MSGLILSIISLVLSIGVLARLIWRACTRTDYTLPYDHYERGDLINGPWPPRSEE